jgi:Tol biopolymer transport system component
MGDGSAWTWSPDGNRIAYVESDPRRSDDWNDPSPFQVEVVNIATGTSRLVAKGFYPAWLSNGTGLVVSDRCRLWLAAATGGRQVALTPRSKGSCAYDPAISPDGRWIAFTTEDTYSSGNGVVRSTSISVVTADGKRIHRAGPIRPRAVRWPHDCRRLFFYKSLGTAYGGWIVHGRNGTPRLAKIPTRAYLNSRVDWHC